MKGKEEHGLYLGPELSTVQVLSSWGPELCRPHAIQTVGPPGCTLQAPNPQPPHRLPPWSPLPPPHRLHGAPGSPGVWSRSGSQTREGEPGDWEKQMWLWEWQQGKSLWAHSLQDGQPWSGSINTIKYTEIRNRNYVLVRRILHLLWQSLHI